MFDVDRVDLGERRVQRGRLARARRPGHQHHAVRVHDRRHQLLLGARLQPELLEVEREVPLVENPEHDLLAKQRGQRGDAVVDDLAADLQLDAAVLRHAALGDVQLRHDLEPGDQRRLELVGRLHDLLQRTVDAVAHAQLVLEALEVDVAGAALHGVGEDGVDQLDDRGVVDGGSERRRREVLVLLLHHLDVALDADDVVEQRLHHRVAGVVSLLDDRAQRVLAGQHREDVVAGDELEVLEDLQVRRVRDGNGERAPLALQREQQVLRRQLRRHQSQDPGIGLEARQVHRREAIGARQHLGQLDLIDRVDLDEGVRDGGAVGLGVALGPIKRLAADVAFRDEEFRDALRKRGDGTGHAMRTRGRENDAAGSPDTSMPRPGISAPDPSGPVVLAERGVRVGTGTSGWPRRTGRTRCHRKSHVGREALRHAVADAVHALQAVERTEWTTAGSARYDALGEGRSDIWERFNLGGRGGLQVHQRPGRWLRGGSRPGRSPSARPGGRGTASLGTAPSGAARGRATPGGPRAPPCRSRTVDARNLGIEGAFLRGRRRRDGVHRPGQANCDPEQEHDRH